MKTLLLTGIRFYRGLLSPYIPSSCRFYPTCSVYSQEAIERYGAWTGLRLATRRLVRCQPWSRGGYDPVP